MKDERFTKFRALTRRDFLKYFSGTTASALLLGPCQDKSSKDNGSTEPTILAPRTKTSNPFVNAAGKPLLVCVSGTNFSDMLAEGLSRLGGLDKLINAAQDVLIKPNCNAADPYPGISDANSVVAIVKAVQNVTSGNVSVADQGYEGAGGVYNFSGLDPLVAQAGADLLIMSQTYPVKRSGWNLNVSDIQVYSQIYDAPIIINTSVLKRHHTAVHTCAIKNLVGAVAGPGMVSTRAFLHNQANDFQQTLAEFACAVNPELNIVDARTILTVNGPRYSNGVPVDVNKVVICGDIVATDLYCQHILADHDLDFAADVGDGVTAAAQSLGLGTNNLADVEIIEVSV